jgi:carbon storage regulator
MLVLTRKSGQSIVIGGDVELTVLEIDGDHIKVGVKAPRSVPVYRSELWAEIQKENAAALKTGAAPTTIATLAGLAANRTAAGARA